MGIIEKQATRNAIYSYIGAGLGFLTTLWLAHQLSPAENGVIGILVSFSALFAQFANLGFTSVTIRFFPYFRNKDKGHHGFLFYAIVITLLGFVLCWIVYEFMKPWLISGNMAKSKLFVDYIFYLMPLTLFTVFFNIFDSYLRAGFSSVIGSFTKDFLQRIFIIIILTLYFFNLFSFPVFIFLYIIVTCAPTLILLAFIFRQKEWHVKPIRGFMSKELRKEMLNLAFYSVLAVGAGAIIINIDTIMVNQMLGQEQTGVYGIAFRFGTLIVIPARSIYRIISGIVAENFKQNKIEEIYKLYIQSCNSQLAIGTLLFLGIWANIDNIMHLLPAAYADGKNVILILSVGYLTEMATGINQVIISNSKHYRWEAYFVFITVVVAVVANYILIPIFGIAGSAMATAITFMFANIARLLFLMKVYKMQPYNFNSLKLIFIALLSYFSVYFIPAFNNFYVDIVIRSGIAGGLFVLLILKMEATPELNKKIRKNIKRFIK